jgi:hypothetical protein
MHRGRSKVSLPVVLSSRRHINTCIGLRRLAHHFNHQSFSGRDAESAIGSKLRFEGKENRGSATS